MSTLFFDMADTPENLQAALAEWRQDKSRRIYQDGAGRVAIVPSGAEDEIDEYMRTIAPHSEPWEWLEIDPEEIS